MKKIYLILFLLSTGCFSVDGLVCSEPSEYTVNTAQSYYNSFGVYRESISKEKAKKLFGCNYFPTTDYIYSYTPFFGKKKYILVRYNKAVTYAE